MIMKRVLLFILVLMMLAGLVPMQVFATITEGTNTDISNLTDTDLFVFAGQSNMMGAAVLEPEADEFTDQAWEYTFMPKLRGAETGVFVPAENPAGEWYYKDLDAAYGDHLNDLSYQSTLSNYSANTFFVLPCVMA